MPRKPDPRVDEAVALVDAGMSRAEAARRMGVPSSAIWGRIYRRTHPSDCTVSSIDADPLNYPMDEAFQAKFWRNVDKQPGDGCWLWTGGKRGPYGAIYLHGQNRVAHRVSLRLHGVELPKGLVVDHKCRNGGCVRPDHLRLVTQGVNTLENSDSLYAKNKAKTHCKHGHPFSGENLIRFLVRRKGRLYPVRACNTCYPQYANLSLRYWHPEDLPAQSES